MANKEAEMAEDAKEIPKRIDTSLLVNADGLTLQDLIVSLCQACDKHGLYACGVIVKKEDTRVAEIFGMQQDNTKEYLSVKVLKQAVDRFDKSTVLGDTRIKTSQTN